MTPAEQVEDLRERLDASLDHYREALNDVVTGRAEQPVLTIYLRMLHDLVQHCGHADILREQVLAAR